MQRAYNELLTNWILSRVVVVVAEEYIFCPANDIVVHSSHAESILDGSGLLHS